MNASGSSGWSPDALARWAEGAWLRPPGSAPCGVCTDTRSLQPGSLFLALRGEHFDGHDYVEEALRGGATAAMVETASLRRFAPTLPLLVVDDTRAGLTRLAAGHRTSLPAQRIGITGSVGKTTVKELLADALAAEQSTYRSPGNWNNDLGVPLSLLQMRPDHAFGVLELGMSHPGEIAPLTELLRPHGGIMTTIGPVHLEAFADEEAIAHEKSELFKGLPLEGWAVASLDGRWTDLLRRAAPIRLVTTSLVEGAKADFVVVRRQGLRFEVVESDGGDRATFEAGLPGRYFAENALLAIAAGRTLGLSWSTLQAAVQAFRPQPMRWEGSCVAGVEVVNDAYNANPLSMRSALGAFAEMTVRGGRWLVLGGMRELGPGSDQMHRELGHDLAAGGWAGLVTCGEDGGLIAMGARGGGMDPARIHACADPEAVAGTLLAEAQAGDAVLLKASRGERLERVLETWNQAADAAVCTPCGVAGEDG